MLVTKVRGKGGADTVRKYDILVILLYLVAIVLCVALGAWFFKFVIDSDLPDWLKYIILK